MQHLATTKTRAIRSITDVSDTCNDFGKGGYCNETGWCKTREDVP